MDRPLSAEVTRRRTARRIALAVFAVALLVGAIVVVPGWIRPSVSLARVRIGTVERGPIEATLTASGLVVPRFEHLITSPIDSRVQEVLLEPGAPVSPGDRLVALDVGPTARALEKLDEGLALKENERRRTGIDLKEALADLEGKLRIKELEIRSYEFDVEKNTRLSERGLITEDVLRRSQTDLERSRIERDQLERAVELKRETAEAKLAGLDLEVSILKKDRADAAERLQLATATADRQGILTWVVSEVGAAVQRGEEIARIADLSSFRVEATLSDVHADRVAAGLPVDVRVGELFLRGRVTNVLPTIEGGTLTLEVSLQEPSHSALRQNLRVEVHIVTERKEDALWLPRGSFVTVAGQRAVFVVHGEAAVRTPVEFGLANFAATEIVHGLAAGDSVILSDMSDHAHVREVRIR
jgi:HlyD family secretion protein